MPAIIICALLTIVYAGLMAAYRWGWARQKDFELPGGYVPVTSISVIIPARNESRNIGACIESILAQQYPPGLYEIIVVDDHSDDGTAGIVNGYQKGNVRCISLAAYLDLNKQIVAYKKAALSAGIRESRGALIVTTDADCIAGDKWLMSIAAIYEQQHAMMVAAPVIYSSDNSIVQIFQLIDFMSMQGITAAAHSLKLGNMSNGANLAFSKSAYEAVGGYKGIDNIASGDDLLLMMKMNKLATNRIAYLRSSDAIVTTTPQPDWASFLQQRIRWASKSGKYNDVKLTGVLVFVYLYNLSFLVLICAGIFDRHFFTVAGGMLFVKIISEYLFVMPVARFFRKEWGLKYFIWLQPLHIIYIVLAGFLGFIGGYKWKGRSVR